MYDAMIAQYGKQKGEEVYYATVNKNKWDDTKAMPSKSSYASKLEKLHESVCNEQCPKQ